MHILETPIGGRRVGGFAGGSRNVVAAAGIFSFFVINMLVAVIIKVGIDRLWFLLNVVNVVYCLMWTVLLKYDVALTTFSTVLGSVLGVFRMGFQFFTCGRLDVYIYTALCREGVETSYQVKL